MTVRQIIQEIKVLPRPDQEELFHALESEMRSSGPVIRYASKEQVDKAGKEIFADYAELFHKLAQ